jgi:hypothetical protein
MATPSLEETATKRTLRGSEREKLFTAATSSDSPRAGSTVIGPRMFRTHTDCPGFKGAP